jgi:phosphate transport system permease protein
VKRRLLPALLVLGAWLATALVLGSSGALVLFLARRGLFALEWEGIGAACAGTLALLGLSICLAGPLGIGCGVYLSEYARGWRKQWLERAVMVLAGAPSIVMGLFGFTLILFLRKTIAPEATTCLALAAGCLALLVLPSLAASARAALEALPESLRLIGPSLGLTRWQSLRRILLPAASRGIWGGVILAMGRAAEDTAVIMLTGAAASAGLPHGLAGKFEALPFMVYTLAAEYRNPAELDKGFSAALTLLILTSLVFAAARVAQAALERTWTIRNWGE